MGIVYELNKEIEQLLEQYYNCFDEETGEQIVEDDELNVIQKQLEEQQNKKDELKTWILYKRANNVANINGIQSEINRLQELLTYENNQVKKSNNFIEYLFKETIKEKPVVFDNFKIGYRKSTSINLSEDFNNEDYKKEKITISYDKTAIRKDLQAGKEINGASIKENLNFYIK